MRGARTGGGTPDGIRPRLDAGLEQGAKPDFLFPLPLPPLSGGGVKSEKLSNSFAGCHPGGLVTLPRTYRRTRAHGLAEPPELVSRSLKT